eukprot:TRINITY_DN26075_c0_g1_i1.p1 TRINITY_DN26075_c0_g1~~TRINITY_DN26075_c0_g1_i1.p1  ORF type:complete len:196 (+),score=50.38 TRINITY_DN26075_c0_g1_i1:39-590(+)
MSFKHSNSLVKAFREAARAEKAVAKIASGSVTGRSEGCRVKYGGCGRVMELEIEECPRFRKAPMVYDFKEIAGAVKEAVLDAQMKMVSVKQGEWQGVNPRILTKHSSSPDYLSPLPHHHPEHARSRAALLSFPFVLTHPEVAFSTSKDEAIENREALRLSLETTFWSGGRAMDQQTGRVAGRS